MNLLAHRIADILFEEGGRFSVPAEAGGRERVEELFSRSLADHGLDPQRVSVEELRIWYHQGFEELLDRLVPADTRDRVTGRFHRLVFR